MYKSVKECCYEDNMKLVKFGLVDLTFGNASVINAERTWFAIKPSGVDYDELSPEKMVIVDMKGNVIQGDARPSSDTATHLEIYKAFPRVRSVVHTHSKYATSFAQSGQEIPCFGTTHADYFRGSIPLTRDMTDEEVGGNYEVETGKIIVERLSNISPVDFPGVLVKNHGPFAWGIDDKSAPETALIMEVLAQIAYQTLMLNPVSTSISESLLLKHFDRKHGIHAYYGQKQQL